MATDDTALRDALAKQVVEHFCNVLNKALVLDRKAISKLFQTRHPCSKDLDEVVIMDCDYPGMFSTLGLLNGLVYSTGWRVVSYVNDNDTDGDIIEFRPGFYPPEVS